MSERRQNDVRYLMLLSKDLTLLCNIRYLTLFQRLSDIYKIPAIEYVTGFEIKLSSKCF